MNKTYEVITKVEQIVTREIHLVVTAGSEEEAEERARLALQTYPEPVEDSHVKSILTAKQHCWPPKSIDFGPIKQKTEK